MFSNVILWDNVISLGSDAAKRDNDYEAQSEVAVKIFDHVGYDVDDYTRMRFVRGGEVLRVSTISARFLCLSVAFLCPRQDVQQSMVAYVKFFTTSVAS
ncbi:hypothetical protein JB92DRAFT_2939681 [Gautieria morchelliformis]|nr:hypothetical protein JB92DRAFT_2939681 [Gautieria morchelliformis]